MATTFRRGQQLGRNDLNIFLSTPDNRPADAAEIHYALMDVTTGLEALVGFEVRTPAHPSVGEYFANLVIPRDANLGLHRIRWTFRQTTVGATHTVVQEFEILEAGAALVSPFSPYVQDLIKGLRIRASDNDPDRKYKFKPLHSLFHPLFEI